MFIQFKAEKSSSLDIGPSKDRQFGQSISLQKQHSLESNIRSKKREIETKKRQLRKSRTSGLYLACKDFSFDYSDSEEEQTVKPAINKLFDETDQIIFKQRLEQRAELYRNKGAIKLSIGKQGTQNGEFKWPRDIRWGKFTLRTKLIGEQVILIADSGNDRIQVLDTQGLFLTSFGKNGCKEAEFDCPSSICCLSDGTIVVSDTNQHRLQWFDSSGNFIRLVGKMNSQTNLSANQKNSEAGQFSFPYGICYEASQNELYVCDKGNQRVQILDDEGNFKRFLSSNPNRSSRLNTVIHMTFKSPNFIHSNSQQIICSDTNSHCVHILSVENGKKIILGGEGTSNSKFKYPRGVGLDEFGFAIGMIK